MFWLWCCLFATLDLLLHVLLPDLRQLWAQFVAADHSSIHPGHTCSFVLLGEKTVS
jgi:hypothetical protein